MASSVPRNRNPCKLLRNIDKKGDIVKECIVTFVRHGIAEGNLKKQHLGVTNSPLAQIGRERLEKLAQAGGYPAVERVYTSPLSRCIDTAGIVYPEHKPIIVDDFIERNFGEYEAKSLEDMKHDPAYMAWVESGFKGAPEGGESLADFGQRSVDTFRREVNALMEEGVTSAAFCIHGGVIMAIMASLILPERDMYDYLPGNGLGYTVRITPELWGDGYRAECLREVPNGNAKAKYRCEAESE